MNILELIDKRKILGLLVFTEIFLNKDFYRLLKPIIIEVE